ncbi:MAG: cadherin-like beta sandwich domain-containing protein, partial [Rhodobacteraceae bacterium]|nr:cadherin-like beta sandwich domain-containing protein [Paracoccaceae bacterium]
MTLLRYIRFLFILAFMLVGLGGLPAVYGQIKVQAPGSFTLSSPSEGVLRLTTEGLSECGAAGTPGTTVTHFQQYFYVPEKNGQRGLFRSIPSNCSKKTPGFEFFFDERNLPSDQLFYIVVQTYYDNGGERIWGPRSEEKAFILSGEGITVVPSAPRGLTATASNKRLDLSWFDSTGSSLIYEVHYTSSSSDTVGDHVPASSGNKPAEGWVSIYRGSSERTTSQVLWNLTNDVVYRVRVRAKNVNYNAYSPWAFIAATPVVPTVSDLKVTPNSNRLDLAWTSDPRIQVLNYTVEYTSSQAAGDAERVSSNDPADGWILTGEPKAPSHAIVGLTNDNRYRVRVRTNSTDGTSAWVVGEGTPAGLVFPERVRSSFGDSPKNLSITPGTRSLSLQWESDVDFNVGVGVQYKLKSETMWRWSGVATASPYEITGLIGDQEYDVRIFGLACCDNSGVAVRSLIRLGSGTPTTLARLAHLTSLFATVAESANGNFGALQLSPAFAPDTTSYTATVGNSTTHLKLQLYLDTDTGATMEAGKGNNLAAVTSGSTSDAIALSVGTNAIKVVVTAADGVTQRTYTITVTRQAANSDATLSGLEVRFSPDAASYFTSTQPSLKFLPSVTSYSAQVNNAIKNVALFPTTSDEDAKILIRPQGSTRQFQGVLNGWGLAVGENIFEVQVIAADERTRLTYKV